jgi:hypothetical protein
VTQHIMGISLCTSFGLETVYFNFNSTWDIDTTTTNDGQYQALPGWVSKL